MGSPLYSVVAKHVTEACLKIPWHIVGTQEHIVGTQEHVVGAQMGLVPPSQFSKGQMHRSLGRITPLDSSHFAQAQIDPQPGPGGT